MVAEKDWVWGLTSIYISAILISVKKRIKAICKLCLRPFDEFKDKRVCDECCKERSFLSKDSISNSDKEGLK